MTETRPHKSYFITDAFVLAEGLRLIPILLQELDPLALEELFPPNTHVHVHSQYP